MKLKNVKVGTRVMLKEGESTFNGRLERGATGIIMEDLDECPRIKWDSFSSGTTGCGMSTEYDIWVVSIDSIKRIK